MNVQSLFPEDAVARELLETCLESGVRFYWRPNWTLLIDIEGIGTVLNRLERRMTILGLEAFTLIGKTVYLHFEYVKDFGDGVGVDEALAAIVGWPRGMRPSGLWIEVAARANGAETDSRDHPAVRISPTSTQRPLFKETPVKRELLEACLKSRVWFRWQSNWTLVIDLEGIELVLNRLGPRTTILGFDGFWLEGQTTQATLIYDSFGAGVGADEALAAIADWPQDTGLWVEVVAQASGAGADG